MLLKFVDSSKKLISQFQRLVIGSLFSFCVLLYFLYSTSKDSPHDSTQTPSEFGGIVETLPAQTTELIPVSLPNQKTVQGDWQNVTGSKYKFGVYSAYCVNGLEVIIIATTKTNSEERTSCKFYFENGDTVDGPALIETMKEHWNKPYSGVFIKCSLPFAGDNFANSSSITVPHSVAVHVLRDDNNTSDGKVSNLLPIQYSLPTDGQFDFKFSVCVLPAFNYNEVLHLVEWLEFYRMMGVGQFTLYNVSIGRATSCVLREYANEEETTGVRINVFPWFENPIKTPEEIRSGPCAECGLAASTNDCLYKHRRNSKYMVFVDFDEFLWSRSAANYSEIVEYPDLLNGSTQFGEFQFRNAFYATQWPDDELRSERCGDLARNDDYFAYQVCRNSYLMRKSLREKEMNKFGSRSKYIVMPERVKQIGNHVVIEFEPGFHSLHVEEWFVFLRHYRFTGVPKHNITNAEVDRIPSSFGHRISRIVSEKLKILMNKCDLEMSDVFGNTH